MERQDIIFEHVSKQYGKHSRVMENFNLKINSGERMILLGPSGCGKSTTLRMIAGLESVTNGNLWLGDKLANNIPCGKRNMAMVFQNYALYPHMSVSQNIVYALKAQKLPKTEIESRLMEVLDMLELKKYADRKPKELSGGQRQRVALARALVKRSPYFLLDEPLSNLDAQLRQHARKEIVKIHEKYQQTLVYVTHDQTEAMTVGNRIALMKDGELQMVDTPSAIYNRPANIFTAKFIGSPSMNIIEGKYRKGKFIMGEQYFELPLDWAEQIIKSGTEEVCIGIRPDHIRLIRGVEEGNAQAIVKYKEDYGNKCGVFLEINGKEVVVMSEGEVPLCGEKVQLEIDFEHVHFFRKDTGASVGYPWPVGESNIQFDKKCSRKKVG